MSKKGQNFKMHRLSQTNILEVDPVLKILYFHKMLEFFQISIIFIEMQNDENNRNLKKLQHENREFETNFKPWINF